MKIFGPLILDKNDASLKFVCEGQGYSRSQFLITVICVDFYQHAWSKQALLNFWNTKLQNKCKGSE